MAHVALWAAVPPPMQTVPLQASRLQHGTNPTPRSCPRAPVRKRPLHVLKAYYEKERPRGFRLENYWQCQIVAGGTLPIAGTRAIQLKLLEGNTTKEQAVTMHIGVWEFDMIQSALTKPEQVGRPLTYDLLGQTVSQLGHKVVSVVIDTMENSTFCSSVLVAPQACPACEANSVAHKLDARPTDAINLALRTKAPVYFSKELAARHARPFIDPARLLPASAGFAENTSTISKSVKALMAQHKDPHITTRLRIALAIAKEDYSTAARVQELAAFGVAISDDARKAQHKDPHITTRLRIALAIAKEDYSTAASLRDKLRGAMARDRLSALVIAMETALQDNRLQEAASLRDQYLLLRGPVQTRQQPR